MIPLCAWRACAQQPPLESVEALTVAPAEEIRLKSNGSDEQVILKNDRLFGVLATTPPSKARSSSARFPQKQSSSSQ